jgi:hypothetical protein
LIGTAREGSGYSGNGVLAEGKDSSGGFSGIFITVAEEAVVAGGVSVIHCGRIGGKRTWIDPSTHHIP